MFCSTSFTFCNLFQTYFLPVIGLVDPEKLKPGDLVGVNKDSYLVLETLPAEYDARVKAMEVDERPTEQYSDIGGLDKQIQEVYCSVYLILFEVSVPFDNRICGITNKEDPKYQKIEDLVQSADFKFLVVFTHRDLLQYCDH